MHSAVGDRELQPIDRFGDHDCPYLSLHCQGAFFVGNIADAVPPID